MCGLMGWVFHNNCPLSPKERAKLLELGAVGADRRGGQSYGTLVLDDPGDKPEVTRGLGALVAVDFDKLSTHPFGFAHSRFSTRGAITVANSHPYEMGSIIGAHNGVIDNAPKSYDVDSMALFDRLDGGKDFTDLEGYGVIEWFDKRTPGILFLANIGRGQVTLFQLRAGRKRKVCGYFWTSLEADGELAMEGAGLPDPKYQIKMKEGEVLMLRRNTAVYSVADLRLEVGERKTKWESSRYSYYRGADYSEGSGGSSIADALKLADRYSGGKYKSPWDWEDENTNPGTIVSLNALRDMGAGVIDASEVKSTTKARSAEDIAEDAAWAEVEAKLEAQAEENGEIDEFPAGDKEVG